MTTILLADHHTLFRAGMVKLIESIGGVQQKPQSNSSRNTPRIFC